MATICSFTAWPIRAARRRVERLILDAKLPRDKSLEVFDLTRLPPKVRTTVATLRDGTFLDQATNVLAFATSAR